MPSVAVKLYSVYFKLILKHKLQSQIQTLTNQQPKPSPSSSSSSSFGITSRPDESTAPANPSFSSPSPDSAFAFSSGGGGGGGTAFSSGGVATKDIHIDPLTSLSVRIFLPDSALSKSNLRSNGDRSNHRRSSYSSAGGGSSGPHTPEHPASRRCSYDGRGVDQTYRGYLPSGDRSQLRKLPIVLQFHGGAFVSGSNVSVANDLFCRRIAKLLDVIVIAVGYRLAPESRFPAAFEDGMKVVHWLGKQMNLAVLGSGRSGDLRRGESKWRIVDTFGAASVEPWLAAHGDPLR